MGTIAPPWFIWRFKMKPLFNTRFFLLSACLVLLILPVGCSDDADPTEPVNTNPTGNTPPLPTVDNPTDQLPETSEMLATDDALLGNFSPKMTDQSILVNTLNDNAIALGFRMVPGHGQLVLDGSPCPPGNLQWDRYGWGSWSDCVIDTADPLFHYLDSRETSHYYGLNHKAYWMVQDLNCRLAGGDLVTIDSADENAFVHNLRQAWLPGEYIALGFYDWNRTNGDFAWRSGEPVTYTSWAGVEPNNSGGEYFAIMATTNSSWNDINGTLLTNAVMEIDEQLPDTGNNQVPVLMLGECPLYLGELGEVAEKPYIVRSVYWKKVFQKTLGAGTTYSKEHSYTKGTEETNGMSFGWSIGISTELGWGPVSTEISMEFHQDFSREITVYEESTVTDTYECTAPAGKTVIFALWQLRERYTICNEAGEAWSDPKYQLDGELPYLDQGLTQEYLQTLYFNQ